jgi:hypothetical protein
MIGPSLPNPFETYPVGGDGQGSRTPPGGKPAQTALDAIIDQALSSEPLAPPPPLLYTLVMRDVRREPRPSFRLHWLDLALSLFAAGMLLAVWWSLRSLPQLWLDYMRLQALYQLDKLWYLNFPLLVWGAAAAGLLATCLAAAALLHPQRSNIF